MACAFQRFNSLSSVCWQMNLHVSTSKSGEGLSLMDYANYIMVIWPDYFPIPVLHSSLFSYPLQSTLNYTLALHHFLQLWIDLAHNSRRCGWFQIYSYMVCSLRTDLVSSSDQFYWPQNTALEFAALLLSICHGTLAMVTMILVAMRLLWLPQWLELVCVVSVSPLVQTHLSVEPFPGA